MIIKVHNKCSCDKCGGYAIFESMTINEDDIAKFIYVCDCGQEIWIESDVEFKVIDGIIEMEGE